LASRAPAYSHWRGLRRPASGYRDPPPAACSRSRRATTSS
jgi:hypothetical protein